ncbi:domain zinc finger 4 [Octopus vulgaris]|uniref:Domain zinc finger 4 n=1 Tax=Octopus vulgaris TaxID=6645 RepID=A0AA36FHE6_OCTVU|nr:domain zinc finger 4 [Octopus vulgaris]
MMSSSAMAESFTLPVNVDQLTCVVDSMVEVSSDAASAAPSLPNVNHLASSPAVSTIADAAAGGNTAADNQTATDTCLPQILQTQASGLLSSTNNVPSLHIPVSLTGHSISMLPLMLSLNLPHRPLISAIDKGSISRASIHTAPTPIPFPSVMAPGIQREAGSCSTVQDLNMLSCIQAESCDNHQHHNNNNINTTTIETLESYPSPATGHQSMEEASCDPNHVNRLITTNMHNTLQNPVLVTSNLSNLSDLRLGMGITSQNDNFPTPCSSMPDAQLPPLLQAANQFSQKHVEHQKSSAAAMSAAPCIMQHNGSALELTNGSAAEIAASISGANLQSILDASLHQQHQQLQEHCNDEVANSLNSIGMVSNKSCDGNTAASLLDINNMSVIDMILKVHQSGAVAATTATTTDAAKDESSSAMVMSGTSCQLGEDMATFTTKPYNQMSFDNFCLECNYNSNNNNTSSNGSSSSSSGSSNAPCQIHNTNYCDIPDTPIPSRARLSTPSLLYLKTTSAHGYTDTLGVWAKETVPCRSRFGPFVAKVKGKCPVDSQKTSDFPIWMIFSKDGQTADALDVSDENECNWMMFVKPARSPEEQNLVAYQQQYSIYFMTCCDVQPHQELLVWYSNDYASTLGVPLKANVTLNCCVCRKPFASHKLLAQHVRSMHPDVSVRRWHCQFCNRGFTSMTKLKTHLLTHIGAKPHSCSQCGKRFTDQSNLRTHQSIHTGERKFPCSVCKKQFRQKAHLTSHMFTHTGEKKLQCQFCEKMFSRSSDLKQHEYQHTREKLFSCSHCDKSFYKMQNFKKHLKIHSGERNFTCGKCHKSFYTKYHLKRHSGTCKGSRSTAAVGDAAAVGVVAAAAGDGGANDSGVGGGGGKVAVLQQSANCGHLHLDTSNNIDDGRGGNDDEEEDGNEDEDDEDDDDVMERNDEEEVEEEEDVEDDDDDDDDDNGGDEDDDEEEEEEDDEEDDEDEGDDCEAQQRTRV